MARRVFITVAEVSGDQHASQLIRSLRELDPELVVEGHGGQHMRKAGAIIHSETTGRAAMGINALARVGEMLKLLKWTKGYFRSSPPDLHICIDSPATNLSFAKAAHRRGIPVLYYIPPQLWAWRVQERRMRKLRKWVDQVACILPFEEEYFRRNGVRATFVGHPLFDELPADRGPSQETKFPHRPPIVGLLAGSRRAEAVSHLPRLLDVARRVRAAVANVSFLIPTTAATHELVLQVLANQRSGNGSVTDSQPNGASSGVGSAASSEPLPIEVEKDGFDRMIPRCDLCLTKSGTSALHVAGYGVPMIVVYRGNMLLWHLLARWLIKARTYSLVNVLSDYHEHIVPEFIPWHGSNEPVARCAIDLLQNPQKLAEQRQKLLHVIQALDRPGASMNTARLAVSMMEGAASAQAQPAEPSAN
jgi:lipid-A-disaccharide synthase